MKLSVLKSSLVIVAAALSTQAFATDNNRTEREIIAKISAQQPQKFQAEKNDYSEIKQELNARLAQLQQTSDMTTFAQLSAEAKDLAEQAKNALASIKVQGQRHDNGNAQLSISASQWRLDNVISSLNDAASQNDVAIAKSIAQANI